MPNAIKVDDISKVYRLYNKPVDRLKESLHPFRKKYHHDFYALKKINIEIKRGEIVGIVGKNGSGKSTLLKIITGVLTPTGGNITVSGRISALLELGSAFNPEYTGIENIHLSGAIMGFSRAAMNMKLDEILAFADIGDFVYQPVKIYSSGMLVRLAFAVAITVDPDILIVDEALSVGDALFQRKCFAKMNDFFSSGKTVLLVSHNMETVAQMCNRAVLLDEGELLLDARPRLVRNYYFKLLYSPAGERAGIRQEIAVVNGDSGRKAALEIETENTTAEPEVSGESATNKAMDLVEAKERDWKNNDFFAADFKSKSRVELKKFDVDIFDVCLKNGRGEPVNHISTDGQYIYSFKVKFNVKADKVDFGMAFKNIAGFTLSIAGAPGRYPMKYLDRTDAGDVYTVDWRFKCSLLAGIYSANAVVRGIVDGQERGFLNRITDALVFRVLETPGSIYKGVVHLEQRAEIRKIH